MKSRRQFRPSLAALEERVVLSHGGARNAFSVVTGALNPAVLTVRPGHQASLVALVNVSFDRFVQDYGQARSAYYAAISNRSATPTGEKGAFILYTQQRVSLLAQQLTNSLLQYSASTARSNHTPPPTSIVPRRINGANPSQSATNPSPFAGGTLGNALFGTIPDAGASPTTIALDSLAQDNAIQAAQVSVINGINIIKNGDFGNKGGHR